MEVSAGAITLRVGGRWLHFTHTAVEGSQRVAQPFHLNENGTVTLADAPGEEMDLAAERFAREIMTSDV